MKATLQIGDTFTVAGIGENKNGHMIRRTKTDNKPPPFWGFNMKTRKRGRAVRLKVFRAKGTERVETTDGSNYYLDKDYYG